MKIVFFVHSLVSDWNHGNAHFLRGVITALSRAGHQVSVFEPEDNWSLSNLRSDRGENAGRDYQRVYPHLRSSRYTLDRLSLPEALRGANLVIVHEWNDPELVARIGQHKDERGRYTLLFHDTHHRMVTAPEEMDRYDLTNYDGVLAFGSVIRDLYTARGMARRAWTWHEAADTRVFRPIASPKDYDLVWVGNWGDEERTAEIHEFLIEPVKRLKLRAKVWGVRYPESAQKALTDAGIEYGGYLPNYEVPEVFSKAKATVHIPRRPYTMALPGIPTIRMFEALACGIPLVSAPWTDAENLFSGDQDYLTAATGDEMATALESILSDPASAAYRARHGVETILTRHTCEHRASHLSEVGRDMLNRGRLGIQLV